LTKILWVRSIVSHWAMLYGVAQAGRARATNSVQSEKDVWHTQRSIDRSIVRWSNETKWRAAAVLLLLHRMQGGPRIVVINNNTGYIRYSRHCPPWRHQQQGIHPSLHRAPTLHASGAARRKARQSAAAPQCCERRTHAELFSLAMRNAPSHTSRMHAPGRSSCTTKNTRPRAIFFAGLLFLNIMESQ